MEPKSLIMDFLYSGRLESAWDIMKKNHVSRDELSYHQVIKNLERDVQYETNRGDIRAVNRLKRRIQSLKTFQEYGLVPHRLITCVDLPDAYHGKVLLVHLVGGIANGFVCLRSGDDWHREILQNTKEEIQDLGFEPADVVPVGGAWVQFDPDGGIIVYGSSEEFGTCDKAVVADLIEREFPAKRIIIRQS
jgi:hypothetical protein